MKDEVLTAFQVYRTRAEKSSGRQIKSFRSDNGGECLTMKFKTYLEGGEIHHIVTPPYSPAQNGCAERANRTIMENARYISEDAQLGKKFWGQAVLTSVHIHNHLHSRSYKDKTPLKNWTGKPPGVGHLWVFGSTTWVQVPKEKRQKLDPKSIKCILVGYEESAGSRV